MNWRHTLQVAGILMLAGAITSLGEYITHAAGLPGGIGAMLGAAILSIATWLKQSPILRDESKIADITSRLHEIELEKIKSERDQAELAARTTAKDLETMRSKLLESVKAEAAALPAAEKAKS